MQERGRFGQHGIGPPGLDRLALAEVAPGCSKGCHAGGATRLDVARVVARAVTPDEISRYVEREQPFDCAGGFKVEALGISLFERVESQDPTALVGLPLIWLASPLRGAGLAVP